MEVAPKVEVLKGETAKLPCKYTVSTLSSTTVVEWYIVSNFEILLLCYQTYLDGKNIFAGESLSMQVIKNTL